MKNTAAFTLIEVLIALLIIAIALAAAISATNNSIRTTIHVKNTVTAHWVGLNILSQMQTGLMASPEAGSVLRGTTSMLDHQWVWRVHAVTPIALHHMHQLTVTVFLKNRAVNTVTGFIRHDA
jgi:general secretion pathway protein I